MLLGTTNLLSGVRTKAFNRSLNDFSLFQIAKQQNGLIFLLTRFSKIQVSTAVISYEQWNRCRVHYEFRGNNQVASDYHDRSTPNQNTRNPITKGKKRIKKATNVSITVIQFSVASVFPFIKTSVTDGKQHGNKLCTHV